MGKAKKREIEKIDEKEMEFINIIKKITQDKKDRYKIKKIKKLPRDGREILTKLDEITNRRRDYLFLRGNFVEYVVKLAAFLKYPEFAKYKLYQGKLRQRYITTHINEIYGGTSGGGVVDIILENDEEIVMISSKIKNEITWKQTDIREIFILGEKEFRNKKKRVYGVVIKDKETQLLVDSDYIKELKQVSKLKIWDYNDVAKMWEFIYTTLEKFDFDADIVSERYGKEGLKTLTLFPHQEYLLKELETIVNKQDKTPKSVLLQMKPRSGKTYLTLYYLYKLAKEKGINKILLLTFYPSLNYQWKTVMKEYAEFFDWNLVISNETDEIVLEKNKVNFIMVSYQEITKEDNYENKEKFQKIRDGNRVRKFKNIKWDVIVWDEVHTASETYRGNKLKEQILKYDLLLALSATPEKNILRGSFDENNTIIWNEIDEKLAKRGEHDKLLELGYSSNELKEKYGNVPDFYYYIIDAYDVIKNRLKRIQMTKTEEELFTMKKLFISALSNDTVLKSLLIMLFGEKIETAFEEGLIWKGNKDNDDMDKMTFLFFVPHRFQDNGKIYNPQEILKDELLKIPVVKEVFGDAIYILNSQEVSSDKILDVIKGFDYHNFKNRGYRIIILIDQLRVGITLNDVTTVVLMDDTASYQKLKQTSYRSQSPYKGKKTAVVIDTNPYRGVTIINSSELITRIQQIKPYATKEMIYEILHKTINIFVYNKSFRLEKKSLDDIVSMYTEAFIKNSNITLVLNRITNRMLTNIDIDLKEKLRKIKPLKFFSANDEVTKKISVNNLANKGKDKITNKIDNGNKGDKIDPNDIIRGDIGKRLRTVIAGLSRLSIVFDIQSLYELKQILKGIKKKVQQGLFDEILNTKLEELSNKTGLSKEDIENEFFDLFKEYLDVEITPEVIDTILEITDNDWFEKQFNSFLRAINYIKKENPEKLEDLMKESDKGRVKYGEVFTPLSTVIYMLEQLPEDIWKNPDLKWIDPSAGTGNILQVIYDVLMGYGSKYSIYSHKIGNIKGLKDVIPDEEERRRHIIENMLYGFELQIKNVIVSKLRINPEGKYKDNIIHGDFFKLIENSEFYKQFDIIVANPPYQYKNPRKKRANNEYKRLYDKFFLLSREKLLKDTGIQVFIHPSSWRLKKEDCLAYIEKQIEFLYLLDHKIFPGSNVDIIVSSNKPYEKPTKIVVAPTNEEDEIDLRQIVNDFDFIPNLLTKERVEKVKKLIAPENERYIVINNFKEEDKNSINTIIAVRDNREFRPQTNRNFSNPQETYSHWWAIRHVKKEDIETVLSFFKSDLAYWISVFSKISQQHRKRDLFEKILPTIIKLYIGDGINLYVNEELPEEEKRFAKELLDIAHEEVNMFKIRKMRSLL